MKNGNKSVLDRLQSTPKKGSSKTDLLLREFRKEEEQVAALKEEIKRLKEEQDKLKKKNPRGAGRKQKFTKEQAEDIRRERKEGTTLSALAKKYQCSVGLIHKLVREETGNQQAETV